MGSHFREQILVTVFLNDKIDYFCCFKMVLPFGDATA